MQTRSSYSEIRTTSSGRYFGEMDGLRGLAILAVILFHLNLFFSQTLTDTALSSARDALLFRIFSLGNSGVKLFFVLSAFLLSQPFAEHCINGKRKPDIARYFRRRLERLQVPYGANLLLQSGVLLLSGELIAVTAPHLIASFFYIHGPLYRSWSTINFVAWSLEVEIQFYCLLPLLSFLFRVPSKWLRRAAFVGAAVSIWHISNLLLPPDFPRFLLLPENISFFLAGMLMADFAATGGSIETKSSHHDGFAMCAAACLAYSLSFSEWAQRFCMPLFLLVAVYSSCRGVFLSIILNSLVLRKIGAISYSVYLYHAIIISFLVPVTCALQPFGSYSLNLALQVLLMLPAIMLISHLFFRCVEQPFTYKRLSEVSTERAAGR